MAGLWFAATAAPYGSDSPATDTVTNSSRPRLLLPRDRDGPRRRLLPVRGVGLGGCWRPLSRAESCWGPWLDTPQPGRRNGARRDPSNAGIVASPPSPHRRVKAAIATNMIEAALARSPRCCAVTRSMVPLL